MCCWLLGACLLLTCLSLLGKSFTFRQLLQHLASSRRRPAAPALCAPLLAGVAVLDAFGNCETAQNHDSSRFSKYLRLTMQVLCTIIHSHTHTHTHTLYILLQLLTCTTLIAPSATGRSRMRT